MSEDMNLSVNGQSKVPPGFRFHPTEEELLHYYLTKKVCCQKIDLDVIRDVDLNKLEPWDIQERCKIGSTPQNDWYFFSHKDKKYPTGTRTNRATAAGFWKATGRDKAIHSNSRRIGMRKTLVFYRGRAPHGQKSDWIMHEYRLELDEDTNNAPHDQYLSGESSGSDEGWVVCRVFKKKNYHKSMDSTLVNPNNTNNEGGVLDHILMYMGRSSSNISSTKQEENEYSNNSFNNVIPSNSIFSAPGGFMHLPSLQESSPKPSGDREDLLMSASSDWAAVDRLVASQLNGQPSKQFSIDDEDFSFCFDHHDHSNNNNNNSDYKMVVAKDDDTTNLWNFGGQPSTSSSSSDPLCHLSV